MTDQRAVRDVLAECMLLERLGRLLPAWRIRNDAEREPQRQRADHILRLLGEHGIRISAGEITQPAADFADQTVWRWHAVGDDTQVREVRVLDDGRIQIARGGATDDSLAVEHEFSVTDAAIWAEEVLRGAPEVRERKGLGVILAALAMVALKGAA